MTPANGALILVAACPEGAGSPSYEEAMEGISSHQEVLDRFEREPFRLGPHTAFLMSRDAARMQVVLVSEMDPEPVRRVADQDALVVEAFGEQRRFADEV